MSKTTPAPRAKDPVDRWRGWVRRGSIALIVATVVPSASLHNIVFSVDTLQVFAWAIKRPHGYTEIQRHMMWMFSAWAWPLLLTGWLGFKIGRTPERLAGEPSALIVGFARRLNWITWLLPCFAVIPYHVRYQAFDRIPLIVAIVAYWKLGHWLRAQARARQGTPSCVFWYMALPLVATLISWVFIAMLFLPSPGYAYVVVVGLSGAWATFVGFVRWWQILHQGAR